MIRSILIDDEQHCTDRLTGMLQRQHAGAGLVPPGHAGDLDVSDVRQVAADLLGEVAFDDLRVVEVHLHLEVGQPHLLADGVRLGLRRFAEQPEALLYLHEIKPEYIRVSGTLLAAQADSPGARRLLAAVQETAREIGAMVDLAAGS